MSDQTLNNIMCMAVIDGKFRSSLLSNPAKVVGDFDLDAEERAVLRTIKADSVTEFARKLHSWMVQRPADKVMGQAPRSRQPAHRLFLEPVD